MDRRRAPFYLRRTKEAMVYFPERQPSGKWSARPVFTKRVPQTVDFKIDEAEWELYGGDNAIRKKAERARGGPRGRSPRTGRGFSHGLVPAASRFQHLRDEAFTREQSQAT